MKIMAEKAKIYESCIPYYSEKYFSKFGKREWKVRGLWFGSRGTVGTSVVNFFNEVKLEVSKISEITESVLIRTIQIINNHVYG